MRVLNSHWTFINHKHECTTRSTEPQYIRGHRLSVTHSFPIQNTLKKHVRLVSIPLLIWLKNNKLPKSRGLSRLGHWHILSNTQAPIRWRIACDVTRTWPTNEATSLTYKGLGPVHQQKKSILLGILPSTTSHSVCCRKMPRVKQTPRKVASVSYTHLTLPTILRV